MNEVPTATDTWSRAFVGRLRLIGIRGDAIGDALHLVDDHCRDTGESPGAAFGDPDAYARDVAAAMPASARGENLPSLHAAWLGGGTAAGIGAVLAGIDGLAAGRDATFTVPDVVGVLLVTLGAGALPRLLFTDGGRDRRWRTAGIIAVFVAAMATVPTLLGGGTVTQLPAWLAMAGGTAVLLATWVPMALRRRVYSDPVTDPVTGQDRLPTTALMRVLIALPVLLTLLAAVSLALLGR